MSVKKIWKSEINLFLASPGNAIPGPCDNLELTGRGYFLFFLRSSTTEHFVFGNSRSKQHNDATRFGVTVVVVAMARGEK